MFWLLCKLIPFAWSFCKLTEFVDVTFFNVFLLSNYEIFLLIHFQWYQGFDVWLRNWRNRGVYAIDSGFGAQTKRQNCRTSTNRRILVGSSRLENTGNISLTTSKHNSHFTWCWLKLKEIICYSWLNNDVNVFLMDFIQMNNIMLILGAEK